MIPMTDTAAHAPTFPVPTSLSPSRVSSFTSCPMQFRFSSIEKLPEAPGPATTRGSIVHRALELLFVRPASERTPEALGHDMESALDEYRTHPDYVGLRLDADAADRFDHDCHTLIDKYFAMEDPTTVREIGLELWMEAEVGALTLRGIIDRLELDADGELVVTDYKTGQRPLGQLRAEEPRRGPLLLVPVRGRLRQASCEGPPDVPLVGRDDRDGAVGAVGEVHHHPDHCGVVRRRAGMHHRRLPSPAEQAV